jgi:CubicO group peptidase (beta-lactamase class C family)
MIRRIAWVLLSVCASVSLAQMPEPGWEHRFDAMLKQGVRENHISGLAIGIVLDGKLAYTRGFGQAALGGAGRPVTPDTLFDMASITKPFVATAIMQLVEQGKIDLDAPVIKYLSYFRLADPRCVAITVRQMVTHTSGMPDLTEEEWNISTQHQNDDGALERSVRSLKGKKLLWNPGAHFAYSNIAFDVLGDVIAKVSGMTFEDYVEQKILKPVGMVSSTLLLKEADPNKLASGYTKNKSPNAVTAEPVLVPYPYDRSHGPSGDLISSVNDMARWAMVNLNRGELDGQRILKNSTYDVMWKPSAELELSRNGQCRKLGGQIGISWFLEQKDDQLYVSHTGGDPGFSALFIMVPTRKFAFVIMANSDSPAGIHFLRKVQADALEFAK